MSKITTWKKIKELQWKYMPSHYRQDVFMKLHHLQQQDRIVEAYIAEFDQLMLKNDLQEPKEHTITHYLGGLRPTISNVVQLPGCLEAGHQGGAAVEEREDLHSI